MLLGLCLNRPNYRALFDLKMFRRRQRVRDNPICRICIERCRLSGKVVKCLGTCLLETKLRLKFCISAPNRIQTLLTDTLKQVVRSFPTTTVASYLMQLVQSAAVGSQRSEKLNKQSRCVCDGFAFVSHFTVKKIFQGLTSISSSLRAAGRHTSKCSTVSLAGPMATPMVSRAVRNKNSQSSRSERLPTKIR